MLSASNLFPAEQFSFSRPGQKTAVLPSKRVVPPEEVAEEDEVPLDEEDGTVSGSNTSPLGCV
jgi:hypothetical protein